MTMRPVTLLLAMVASCGNSFPLPPTSLGVRDKPAGRLFSGQQPVEDAHAWPPSLRGGSKTTGGSGATADRVQLDSDGLSAAARRLRQRSPVKSNSMWGTCDEFQRNATGCSLEEGATCSHRTRLGPTGADVAFELAGLPPSRPGHEVHLHFWAARKSVFEYDPLTSYNGCAFYHQSHCAYPDHKGEEFNGGNVRVDEEGRATLMVMAPATYRVYCNVVFPHVHLRLCTGESFAHAHADSLVIGESGPFLSVTQPSTAYLVRAYAPSKVSVVLPQSEDPDEDSDLDVSGEDGQIEASEEADLDIGEVSQDKDQAQEESNGKDGAGPSVTTARPPSRTTAATAGQQEQDKDEDNDEEEGKNEKDEADPSVTTASPPSRTTAATAGEQEQDKDEDTDEKDGSEEEDLAPRAPSPDTDSKTTEEEVQEDNISPVQAAAAPEAEPKAAPKDVDGRIEDALQVMQDMDALEFSPVYNCLLADNFYSTRSGGCAQECPSGDAVVVGQCVLPEVRQTASSFSAGWHMTLDCGEDCWSSRLNQTLHHMRLSAGTRLRIPFGEVEVAFKAVVRGRRLGEQEERSATAVLRVLVRSRRVGADSGLGALDGMLSNAVHASYLTGLPVLALAAMTPSEADEATAGAKPGDAGTLVVLDDSSDPYAEAYTAVLLGASGRDRIDVASPAGPFAWLSWYIAIPALVICASLAGAAGLAFARLRRRSRLASLAAKHEKMGEIPDEDAKAASNDGGIVVAAGQPVEGSAKAVVNDGGVVVAGLPVQEAAGGTHELAADGCGVEKVVARCSLSSVSTVASVGPAKQCATGATWIAPPAVNSVSLDDLDLEVVSSLDGGRGGDAPQSPGDAGTVSGADGGADGVVPDGGIDCRAPDGGARQAGVHEVAADGRREDVDGDGAPVEERPDYNL